MADNFPFPTDPTMMAVAIAYRNKRLIADGVLPRAKAGKMEFKYFEHKLEEGFTVPDTIVGRKSKPNEVEFTATETSGMTKDYALDDPIPNVDIQNAPKGHDPAQHAVVTITNLIMLDREIRVANKVFDPAIYSAANKVQLSGTSQFSDYNNSDPITDITTGIDALIMRPNVMAIGRKPYSVLRRHPDIVKSINGTTGDKGIVRLEDMAELFELDKILVGEAFVNTARKGQPHNMQRVWGNHLSLHYLEELVETTNEQMPTFGFTAQFGDRLAGGDQDANIGMRGGTRVRVGESVEEVISSPDLGYFIEDVV